VLFQYFRQFATEKNLPPSFQFFTSPPNFFQKTFASTCQWSSIPSSRLALYPTLLLRSMVKLQQVEDFRPVEDHLQSLSAAFVLVLIWSYLVPARPVRCFVWPIPTHVCNEHVPHPQYHHTPRWIYCALRQPFQSNTHRTTTKIVYYYLKVILDEQCP